MTATKPELNSKEQIFVREYLVDQNGARAAGAAGYSRKTAAQAASRLLRNVHIQAAISERTEQRLTDLDISADKVLRGIAGLAFFDPRKLFNADGSLKPITELDDITVTALSGIDVQETTESREASKAEGDEDEGDEDDAASPAVQRRILTRKIRLADRGQNLERLGRHFKLFSDVGLLPPTIRVLIEHIGARASHPSPAKAK